MGRGQLEQRIIRLEQLVYPIPARLRRLEDAAGRAAQAFQVGIRAGYASCVTTFTGTVVGCTGAALSPSSIHILGHVSGLDYGTFATSSGAFSVPLTLDGSDTSIDLSAIGPTSARWAAGALVNKTFSACGSNALGSFAPAPGTGYYCSGACLWPAASTLTLVDSVYGTYTLHYDSLNPGMWRTSTPTANTYEWFYSGTNALHVSQGHITNYGNSLITSITCPDATNTLDLTYTLPVDANYPAGGTVRIHE